MESNLNVLETKVLEAVDLIKELRQENGRLTARCEELAAQAEENEAARRRLTQELEEARNSAADVEVYETKRKEIEDKVGGLLLKLESLG